MQEYDVIVVGAGFSGMYALHKLRSDGLNVHVFDAAGDVGGTWWYNRYPGARVDGPSTPYYGFMFSKELADEWDWEETQSAGPQILAYMNYAAKKFDLKKDITFNTRVESAAYNEAEQNWTIETDTGVQAKARYLVCGLGLLYVPNMPDYPGIQDFKGAIYHTGRWPHEEVSFEGKRVGVIGTGSSGIQVIPEVAKQAEHVTVFQRTAQFSLPARNRRISKEELKEARDNWEEAREKMCANIAGFPFEGATRIAGDYTVEERHELYETLWEEGGFNLMLQSFRGIMAKQELNEEIGDFVREKIRGMVDDPETAEKLVPKYLIGTKRLIMDTGYYDTYNQDHVTLVDIKDTPIEKFSETAVHTKDGEHPIDVLVLATGFDAVTGSIMKLNPKGRGGECLADKWAERHETYMGVTIPDFPNLFVLQGPGSPGVFFTVPLGSERSVDWVSDCIRHMQANDYATINAQYDKAVAWGEQLDALANATLFPKTPSWYSGANIPGKSRQFLGHIDGAGFYARLAEIAENDYEGFDFEPKTEAS